MQLKFVAAPLVKTDAWYRFQRVNP